MARQQIDFNDPITLQVLWNRLIFIADQADRALGRTAFSPVVRENHDYVTVLMDAKGRALAQCTWAIPVFITSLPMAAQHYFLPAFPPMRQWRTRQARSRLPATTWELSICPNANRTLLSF